ncbi:MAG TPA: thiamine pyrophosphate-dependent enzyme [Solirubrobacteraceae bacterium]|jgi:benzoylformate decarboxylase
MPARETAATVRDATFDVMRQLGMTRIFGNPGTTEIPFLVGLPDDLKFVMGLHEGSVVSIATGVALVTGEPQFVNLHTAPGLGNAINAIANARDLHAPLVLVVGQQDRAQLSIAPFLSGRALERVAGDYPVWSSLPVRPQDVPAAVARAYWEALAHQGPALVVVPMGDWLQAAAPVAASFPASVVHPGAVSPAQLRPLAELLAQSQSPAIVTGGGNDSQAGWDATVRLAERLGCPVFHEPFSARASFPETHPQFAGHLDWRRRGIRDALAPYDTVLVLGTKAFLVYILEAEEPIVTPQTRVAVITSDSGEAHVSGCEIAVVGPVAPAVEALGGLVSERSGDVPVPVPGAGRPAPVGAPEAGEPLTASQVLSFVAERWPADGVLVEESPSSRPELLARFPARAPLGWLSNGNGGLGFGLGGAVGVRMAAPERPVMAVVGDGSAMFGIQALWSAAHYGVGVLMIVMSNGNYGVMDAQAGWQDKRAPWPQFPGLDIAAIARGLGCPAARVETYEEMTETLGEALDGLAARSRPLLVEIVIAQDDWS